MPQAFKRWQCAMGHVIFWPETPKSCGVKGCNAPIMGQLLRD